MDALLNDTRFAFIAKDPKFKRIPKTERKVKIDKRFQGMFKDKKFAVQYTIDKRGRPISQTSSENLKKYYDLSSSDEEEEEEEEEVEKEINKTALVKKKEKAEKEKSKKKKNKNKSLQNLKSKDINYEKNDMNNKDADENSDSSDNCYSSNGELLRIKPKESVKDSEESKESESESESESNDESISNENTLKADLEESKKQLYIKKENESNKLSDKVKNKLRDLSVNYARGEGVLMTDSSSDDDDEDDDDAEISDEEEIEHKWGELDKEADTTDDITHRLAVCNMDWDRIRAVDLMVLFNSFLPSGGIIHSVKIYPSEFGLQRMKEEEITGPKELIEENKKKDFDDENEDEEGSAYHMEKLRQYQLNRLKYYYAVVEFDSAETANKIYMECDGTEYESTATKLDLRFISDDTEFDQTPKEVCNEMPQLSKYEPRQFTTTALQQVKVELTWDETNPERMEIAQKLNSGKLDNINEKDLHAYLATDSSDEEEDVEKKEEVPEDQKDSDTETNADPIEKYKALLREIEEKEEAKQNKEVELEFTWGLGTKEKAEKLVKEKMKKTENLTPFEQYLEKRKEKKKAKKQERKKRRDKDASSNSEGLDSDASESDGQAANNKSSSYGKKKMENSNVSLSEDSDNDEKRKAELELLLMDEDQSDGKQHFNMKKIEENATMSKSKQKRLSKKKNGQNQVKEDNFEVNVQDPRFNALFTSHHYNIDPADPHYRKTKGTEALIKEKLKRRADDDPMDESDAKSQKTNRNTDLQVLVRTIKRNAKNISRPIK
ncbi:ESF1 homolog isoform X2 [Nomia melanderi]|uniref:ESF1 homolog isoform X2 n=1 Tax=Nomia melanderi TaxID=2448451 RepID=UPI0013047C46|nr:ESF1 homolog isoform X2 [Nomia melanderi]